MKTILPTVDELFDSMWIADHFYGFDEKTDPFVEAWTSLTWLAAKFPNVLLCHHVLGHGYRPPVLTAEMAATLQHQRTSLARAMCTDSVLSELADPIERYERLARMIGTASSIVSAGLTSKSSHAA